MNGDKPLAEHSSIFGLIVESDFHHTELHGFEVDMNGRIVTPEFHPQRVRTESLSAIMTVTAKILAAIEDAA